LHARALVANNFELKLEKSLISAVREVLRKVVESLSMQTLMGADFEVGRTEGSNYAALWDNVLTE